MDAQVPVQTAVWVAEGWGLSFVETMQKGGGDVRMVFFRMGLLLGCMCEVQRVRF